MTKKVVKEGGEKKVKRNRVTAPEGTIEIREVQAQIAGLGETTTEVYVVSFDGEEHSILGPKKEARARLKNLRALWRKEHVTDQRHDRMIRSLLSGLKRRSESFAEKFGDRYPELSADYQKLYERMCSDLA